MSTPMHMTNCPSEEQLAAFIDGRLEAEANQRVVEHITTCGDCYDIVSTAWDFQAAERKESGRGGGQVVTGRFGFHAVWAAAAAVAASVVIVFLPPVHDRLFPPSPMTRLISASERLDARPVEGRLSGGFPYKKPFSPKRGDVPPDIAHQLLDLAAKNAELTAQQHPSAQTLAAAGTSDLLTRRFSDAIQRYSDALVKETETTAVDRAIQLSKNADLLNDLAVAYSERGSQETTPADHRSALNAIGRAAQLKNKDLVILWNRAFILERAGLSQQALKEWQRYLELDSSSPWADEARTHENKLATPDDGPK